jgi:hypothetical protein
MASTLPGYKDAPTNPAPVGQEAKYVRLADVNGLLDHTSGWVNVKSYGAVGDGTTDDSAAIQAAIAGGTGGQVHFPAGIYRVTSTLAVPADTRLSGVNQRKSIIRKGFSGTLLTLADGAGFSTLSLEGQGATYTGRGVVMSGTAGRQSVSHARVIDFESHPIEFEPRAGSQSSWLDVEAYRTGGTTGSDKFAVSIAHKRDRDHGFGCHRFRDPVDARRHDAGLRLFRRRQYPVYERIAERVPTGSEHDHDHGRRVLDVQPDISSRRRPQQWGHIQYYCKHRGASEVRPVGNKRELLYRLRVVERHAGDHKHPW